MLRRFLHIILLLALTLCFANTASGKNMSSENIWKDYPHHKKVKITPYIPNGNNNIAIVVCPGGSYFWHDMRNEGTAVAKWLQSNGIAAFVLKYRTGGFPAFFTGYRYLFRGNRYPDPQDDLRQAIRYIKDNCSRFGVDTTRIGAMGFSAGGHLVMSAAELFDKNDRPAFVAPIYPVVTMSGKYVHKRSRRALLGDNKAHDKIMQDSLSLEKHVHHDCPPVFLLNCIDDHVVRYQNSVLLDSALCAQGVSHVYTQFHTGGHGFGASTSKGTSESRQWMQLFINWIKQLYPDFN